MKKEEEKTNVMRILDQKKVKYTPHSYDPEQAVSGVEVAAVLRQDEERGEYLHFKVAEVLQIQNLLENMIYSLVTGKGDQNRINQTTMGLIFLYLLESVQYAEMRLPNQYENMITMTTLDYIEQQYKTATLIPT